MVIKDCAIIMCNLINTTTHTTNTNHFQQCMDQPSMVAQPARGQINKDDDFFPGPVRAENFVSRDRFGRPVPHSISYVGYIYIYTLY